MRTTTRGRWLVAAVGGAATVAALALGASPTAAAPSPGGGDTLGFPIQGPQVPQPGARPGPKPGTTLGGPPAPGAMDAATEKVQEAQNAAGDKIRSLARSSDPAFSVVSGDTQNNTMTIWRVASGPELVDHRYDPLVPPGTTLKFATAVISESEILGVSKYISTHLHEWEAKGIQYTYSGQESLDGPYYVNYLGVEPSPADFGPYGDDIGKTIIVRERESAYFQVG